MLARRNLLNPDILSHVILTIFSGPDTPVTRSGHFQAVILRQTIAHPDDSVATGFFKDLLIYAFPVAAIVGVLQMVGNRRMPKV